MEKGMQNFDPLDMNNYRIEKLPKLNKSGFEKWMAYMGGPLAVLVFAFLYWFSDISFLQNIDPATLTQNALKRFNEIGADEFSRIIMPCWPSLPGRSYYGSPKPFPIT